MSYADAVAHAPDACIGYACGSRVPAPYACVLYAAALYACGSCVPAPYACVLYAAALYACGSRVPALHACASYLPAPYTYTSPATYTSYAPAARRLLLSPRQRLRSVTSSVRRVSLTLRST
ncbi:hypothetical protein DDE74_14080 [Streptomyces lydicus]|uniref:Uncharacterized protein n=1 Tax=Streptomyces lydicus TaxID=47763 RepID=A0A3Q9K4T1_9ACTN|nr:hypothetical protein DDE74_14080 [Streptomyces lydicus]